MKRLFIFLAGFFICGQFSIATAAPKADLWVFWDHSNEAGTASLDHSAWQEFLDTYLVTETDSGVYLVRYRAVTDQHRKVLDAYIDDLQTRDPREYSKAEQMAYWINLYNAVTVQLVLDHPDKTSILRMGQWFFSIGPWNDKLLNIAGEDLALNDIEHRILRPIWNDHRIHFAVNCASIGCPNLVAQAYTRANTEALLQQNERAYINHPRGVSFSEQGRLTVSQIFKWYRKDFAGSSQALLEYLASHADAPVAQLLRSYDSRIRYDYDWSLNSG
jgi:hypothetical protein